MVRAARGPRKREGHELRHPSSLMRRTSSPRPGNALLVLAILAVALTAALIGDRSASSPAAGSVDPPSAERYAVRGIYDRDTDRQAALGFNFMDSGPFEDQMQALADRNLKGFVWLGGYSNRTCTFNYSDDWVRSHVAAIAGHPGVGAYFIDDEPDASRCPSVPAQINARARLVDSIDPGPPTFIVTNDTDQLALYAGKVDVLGLGRYPCSIRDGCDYSKIDAQAAEADRLGVRYWGVIQAHGDDWYKVPTSAELHQQFAHWRATNMEGYLVFAWRYPDARPALWLANNPPLQAALHEENRLPRPDHRYAVRGIYDRDTNRQAALGFNFMDSGPYEDQMQALADRGLKGFVWLGGYSNSTCRFNYTNDWVRSHVAAIAGHPGVGAYFIDDEPDAVRCPTAPAQIRARARLVRSLDPGPPTFIVTNDTDQLDLFAPTVDVLALDHYPCSIVNGCDYSKIDAQAAEADRLGVRYWGVIQAHGDDWYRVPTPAELHQQFAHWRATSMEGYLVFAWRFPDNRPGLWLANNLPLQTALRQENGTP
jgi:hypothetical protein